MISPSLLPRGEKSEPPLPCLLYTSYINYVKGANIAGFMKVAHAMMGQGIIGMPIKKVLPYTFTGRTDVYKRQDYMLELRSSGNDIVAPYADEFPGSTFIAGKRPWEVKADIGNCFQSCTNLDEDVYSYIQTDDFFKNEQEMVMNIGRIYDYMKQDVYKRQVISHLHEDEMTQINAEGHGCHF